jgi:hypothetical protein
MNIANGVKLDKSLSWKSSSFFAVAVTICRDTLFADTPKAFAVSSTVSE